MVNASAGKLPDTSVECHLALLSQALSMKSAKPTMNPVTRRNVSGLADVPAEARSSERHEHMIMDFGIMDHNH